MLSHLKNSKLFKILALILVFLIIPHSGYSYMNLAEVYCKTLGYESKSIETAEGEVGICIFPDNTSANEWDFLRGREALQWSYCVLKGYEVKHLENSEICKECTVCVLPNGTEIEVTKLMGLSFE
jgi:putative hemolysin